MKLKRLLLVATLALPVAITHADNEPAYIYGGELMSARERDRYRHDLQQRSDPAEQAKFRQQHRERIRKRAQQRGVEIDATQGVIRHRGGRGGE